MRARATLLLIASTFAVSSAAVLVVLSGLDAPSIGLWRLGATVVAFAPFARGRIVRVVGAMSRGRRLTLLVAGATYGLHFVWWPMGFERTSYESTVVLLALQPVLACVLGLLWLGEPVTRRMGLSIAIAGVGLVLLVAEDYSFRPEHLIGDGIVIASVLAIVVTVLAGRRLRQELDFAVYVTCIAAVATGTAMVAALTMDAAPLTSSRGAAGWCALALLVAVPTLFGYAGFHYLVKEVPVFYLNLVIVAEPAIALGLKYGLRGRFEVFRDTELTTVQLVASAILLGGVAFGLAERGGAAATSPARRADGAAPRREPEG